MGEVAGGTRAESHPRSYCSLSGDGVDPQLWLARQRGGSQGRRAHPYRSLTQPPRLWPWVGITGDHTRIQGLASGFISWRKVVKLVTVQLDDDRVSEVGTGKQLALWLQIRTTAFPRQTGIPKLSEEKMGNSERVA